jgi:hypothetical protein
MTISTVALSLILLATTSARATVEEYPPSKKLSEHTFTRSHRLEVTAQASTGDSLPGVTVSLCVLDASRSPMEKPPLAEPECRLTVTDAAAKARFAAISPGKYYLTGELDGFARTAIYPLSIGGEDPIAPDQIVLTLNPVCWDC